VRKVSVKSNDVPRDSPARDAIRAPEGVPPFGGSGGAGADIDSRPGLTRGDQHPAGPWRQPAREHISAVIAALDLRADELGADVYQAIVREVPQLRDERILALMEACVAEDVTALVHILQHGIDPSLAHASATAGQHARRLAQRGVPITTLLRAYRIASARFLEWCMNELSMRAAETAGVTSVALGISRVISEYFDRISEEVARAYEQEREDWLKRPGAAQSAWVRAVLNREALNTGLPEAVLGYRLSQHHVGIVCWVDDEEMTCTAAARRLEQATVELANREGCQGQPVFVPQDESTAWAWLPLGGHAGFAQRTAETVAGEAGVRFAIGSAAGGVSGFRQTHQQALRTHAVALAAGPRRQRVTSFQEVAPIAMMSGSLGLLREWVRQVLGSLADDNDAMAVLRVTLRVFLQENGSYHAAARRMSMHKNTVQYRVRKAEKHLGGRLTEDRLDIEIALLACEQVPPAVLASGSAKAGPASSAPRSFARPSDEHIGS
jgi:hypothetical protein